MPATTEAQATAEIKLALAILKYARHARGGRIEPAEVSDLLDQAPPLRDPKTVLTEIAAAAAPDAYLRSLHPKHEQFERLRQALLKARGKGEGVTKQAGSERDIQRLLINMERWRWMPEDLGTLYVWNNVPEYILRVVKNGAAIHSDKIVVGKLAYATPIFSANMHTIVFNPEWTSRRPSSGRTCCPISAAAAGLAEAAPRSSASMGCRSNLMAASSIPAASTGTA